MRGLQIVCLLIFVIFITLHTRAAAQSLLVDSTASSGVKNALAFYNSTLADQLHLYNGKEYRDYYQKFEVGQPYFLQPGFSVGKVDYDGNIYKDVAILYNVVSDQVVILNYKSASKIQLIKEKISAFAFSGHSFINIPRDSLVSTNLNAGFYDVLTAGKITLLARRTKNIQTYVRQVIEYKVFTKDHFYLKRNSSYISVHSKRSFLEHFGDRKKEIQQYIKQNRLRFRQDQENFMIKTVAYYNLITKSS